MFSPPQAVTKKESDVKDKCEASQAQADALGTSEKTETEPPDSTKIPEGKVAKMIDDVPSGQAGVSSQQGTYASSPTQGQDVSAAASASTSPLGQEWSMGHH